MNTSLRHRLLFISAYLPDVRSREAGQKTAFRNLALLSRYYTIDIVTFRREGLDDGAEALRDLCSYVSCYTIDRARRVVGSFQRIWWPVHAAVRYSGNVQRELRRLVAENKYDRVHCEWVQSAMLVPRCYSGEITVVAHDDWYDWCLKRARRGPSSWAWYLDALRTRLAERRMFLKVSRLYCLSERDRVAMAQRLGRITSLNVASLVPKFDRYVSYQHVENRRSPEALTILFWGALGRIENQEAARWVVRTLVPALRVAQIQFSIIIAGANPPSDIVSAQGADIAVTGYLDDPGSVFENANLAIAPLTVGAGIKIKVLECLAAGLPTLTTAIGAEGIGATWEDGLLTMELDVASWVKVIQEMQLKPGLLLGLSRSAWRFGDQLTARAAAEECAFVQSAE